MFIVVHPLYQGEQLYAPDWHPTLMTRSRPYWVSCQQSPAALSFNYAIEQYTQPLTFYSRDFHNCYNHERNVREESKYYHIDELDKQIAGKLLQSNSKLKTKSIKI